MGQQNQGQGKGNKETQQGGKTQSEPMNDPNRSNNPNRQNDERGGGQGHGSSGRGDQPDSTRGSGTNR